MNKDQTEVVFQYQPFIHLSEKQKNKIQQKSAIVSLSRGDFLSRQGTSVIDGVYFVMEGVLELFYEVDDDKILSGYIQPGEVFGAITLLFNDGVCIRTSRVKEDVQLFKIPAKIFLETATSIPKVYEYYQSVYKQMMMDDTYAGVLSASRMVRFLSQVLPFSYLEKTELEMGGSQFKVDSTSKKTCGFCSGKIRCSSLVYCSARFR